MTCDCISAWAVFLMAFTKEQTDHIESAMADFLARRRPPEEIRDKLDLGWRIEGQLDRLWFGHRDREPEPRLNSHRRL